MLKFLKRRENKSLYRKNKWFFFSNYCYDEQMAVVTNLKETSRPMLFFWLKVQTSLKQCTKLQKKYFFKNFQGEVDCSFDNTARLLRQRIDKESSFRILKEYAFFSILRGFSSICSSGYLLQFWEPWKKYSLLSVKLHLKSLKPKFLNSLFQKSYSASNPLDT